AQVGRQGRHELHVWPFAGSALGQGVTAVLSGDLVAVHGQTAFLLQGKAISAVQVGAGAVVPVVGQSFEEAPRSIATRGQQLLVLTASKLTLLELQSQGAPVLSPVKVNAVADYSGLIVSGERVLLWNEATLAEYRLDIRAEERRCRESV